MKIVKVTEFRKKIKEYFILSENETIIITSSKGKKFELKPLKDNSNTQYEEDEK